MPLPENPTVVITGASSGIGRALAIALAQRGARLHLAARDRQKLEAVARDCAPAEVQIEAADLTDETAVEKLAARVADRSNRIDVVIHSMGIFAAGPIEATPVATLDAQYRTNVRTPFVITQALLPWLRQSQGQVVFLNSSVIQAARPGVSAYAASKHALRAVADTLREEVNGDGVRVLSVYPGRTATAMQQAIMDDAGRAYHPERLLQPEDIATSILAALELPRTAELTDIYIRPMLKG